MSKETHKWGTLIGTGISALFVGVDFTIVTTALANIQASLNTNLSELQWVMAGFGLTFCTFLISMGRLGDLVGRRLMLYIGIIGFILSSLGSGLSHSALQLIIFRIFQGAFGAIIFPCGLALTSNSFPQNEQGKAIGLYTSILGIGFAMGPVLGGLLVAYTSWRWIFLINIPIGLLSLLICIFNLTESRVSKKIKIDWWGMGLITLGLATAVFAITRGAYLGWHSPIIISCFIIAVLTTLILIIVESRLENPLISFQLLSNRSFFLGLMLFIVTLGFSWTVSFFIPLYLAIVLQFSPQGTGFMLLIMTAMTFIVPNIAGRIYDRKGKKTSVYLVLVLAVLSFGLMTFFNIKGPIGLVILGFLAYGSAWGAVNGVAMPICFSEQKTGEDTGLVSGAVTTLFNIFGLLLFSVLGMLFSYIQNAKIFTYLHQANLKLDHQQIKLVHTAITDPEKLSTLLTGFSPKLVNYISFYFRQSFVDAFHFIMMVMLLIVIISCFIVFILLRDINDKRLLQEN